MSTALVAGVTASVKNIALVDGAGVEEEQPPVRTLLEEDGEEIEEP